MLGYVKLYRQSIESSVFQNANLWKVWTYCLMRANHKENKILFHGDEITLTPGEFVVGRIGGSKDCNMKQSTFRDQLKKLQKLEMIDVISDNKKSVIKIQNWNKYQNDQIEKPEKPDIISDSIKNSKSQASIEDSQLFKFEPDSNSDNNPTTTRHRQECNNERNIYISEKSIFDYWNMQQIKRHGDKLFQKYKSKISTALKYYSEEDLKTAISNYSIILKSEEYFFNYKWTLIEFLSRGVEKFIDLETAKSNYIKKDLKHDNQKTIEALT
ncbi:MAG: hypothetical protein CMF23_14525 [Ignavibacteriae bacterium]|nr:hypothetical protein [Ignavibacteriota bacterium]